MRWHCNMEKKLNKLEIILVSTLLVIHLAWYNTIGHLASMRGLNFGRYLYFPIENSFPIWLWLSPLYLFIWIYPLLILIWILIVRGWNVVIFRRIYCSFLVMMIAAYLFWLAFPVKFTDRLSDTYLIHQGLFGYLTLYIYNNATAWNAFPSFHIAVTWFSFRIIQYYVKKYYWITWLICLATIVTTLVIRIHYIADSVGGILLAELIFQCVNKPIDHHNFFSKDSNKKWISIYLIILVIALGLWALVTH